MNFDPKSARSERSMGASYIAATKYSKRNIEDSVISPNKRIKSQPVPPSSPCRFIPSRQSDNLDYCNHELEKVLGIATQFSNSTNGISKQSATPQKPKSVVEILTPQSDRMVNVFGSISKSKKEWKTCTRIDESIDRMIPPTASKVSRRILPSKPYRVLDAPDIFDDYYLNLLHWGSNNIIAIALQKSVYLWNAETSQIDHLVELTAEDDVVTSVQWSSTDSNFLAVGTNNDKIQLWDTTRMQMVREMGGHTSRVSSLAWNPMMGNILSSGSRDSLILHHDSRSQRTLNKYVGHEQEICGLSWSPDGKCLASGGNENLLCLWDASMSANNHIPLGNRTTSFADVSPLFVLDEHQAAVKALAWCPWDHRTLASGGGTADRTIRLWNSVTGSCLRHVDTGSQVCAMQWNENHKELLSSHGFSDNQLILWHPPTMSRIKEFRAHTARVLHMAKSPDGSSICTASADETLRFWDIFKESSGCTGKPPSKLGGSGMKAGIAGGLIGSPRLLGKLDAGALSLR